MFYFADYYYQNGCDHGRRQLNSCQFHTVQLFRSIDTDNNYCGYQHIQHDSRSWSYHVSHIVYLCIFSDGTESLDNVTCIGGASTDNSTGFTFSECSTSMQCL